MLNANSFSHIYQRSVSGGAQDSLSIIATLIQPGQTLLDLGMGAGGLGQHLSQHFDLVADGVSLNQAEADIARQWYRQVTVADLDVAELGALFPGQQYDCIVCADVLEHLRSPQQVLAQCKALLKLGGRLITSVPNAGYCGLIAELIEGEFRYRPEGLLDSTHLRFFTRKSLQRFFAENGWSTLAFQTTQRNLLESEFQVAFDKLPPAVARHLLALPDAQTYQFISVLQPAEVVQPLPHPFQDSADAVALFSAQVHLKTQSGYREDHKLVAAGQIGVPRQLLSFDIPAGIESYTSIRLDPADRPGFFRLHCLLLQIPNGDIIWHWDAGQDDLAVWSQMPHQQILLQQPWALTDGILLLLYGDDPWLELPLTADALQQVTLSGARLVVTAGWPMSADYLQTSTAINSIEIQYHKSLASIESNHCKLLASIESNQSKILAAKETEKQQALQTCAQQTTSIQTLEHSLRDTENALTEAHHEKLKLSSELHAAKLENRTSIKQYEQLISHLQGIEKSTLFRVTRPIVRIKMKLDRWLGKTTHKASDIVSLQNAQPLPLPVHPVDIIVPVYRGLEDTRCCIESVLNAKCQTAWRLIIINDCSPEPAISEWLRNLAATDSRVELLENTENLGFVATVNRGMALSDVNDVLLLNSDAEVANDWLDRIQRAGYSAPCVASVTPFSNNATICSYPRFCEPNEMPANHDTASLDKLFAQHLAGQTAAVPTGVGFCMYIRRQALNEVGLFDVANFGKGYGEECDFCQRAQSAGWAHLHALDTFVRHAGGISFGGSKNQREQQAMETLNRLHPKYEALVHHYLQRDPASDARMVIDIARIIDVGKPVILTVTHNREGGTLRHIEELAHYLAQKAVFLRLWPVPGGVLLKLEGRSEAFELYFTLPRENEKLLQTLRMLRVAHVHYHHLLGHSSFIAALPELLQVKHDFTAHDYYSACPQISLTNHTERYCGEKGLAQCRQCLQNNPAPGGVSIETWRDQHKRLLSTARYLITPSHDTADRMRQYVPEARIRVVPHSTLLPLAPTYREPCPRQLSDTQPLRIAVIGALSKIKGADVLEAVATLAANKNSPIEFHLIGYAYRQLRTQPKANLTVHGAYDEPDLQKLLKWLKPDLLWFPAQWPETYSYTLSAGLEASLPMVAPDLGAFFERLQGRSWTWIIDWQLHPSDWLKFFETIRAKNFMTGQGPELILSHHDESLQTNYSTVNYHENYCPSPMFNVQEINTDELLKVRNELQSIIQKNKAPNASLKSSALNALIQLRSVSLLSPMAKIVPMHLQRRVKSWLGH